MITHIQVTDAADGLQVITPLAGKGALTICEMLNDAAKLTDWDGNNKRLPVTVPSYAAIRDAMLAAGLLLDCAKAPGNESPAVSPAAAPSDISGHPVIGELLAKLAERDSELAIAKSDLSELIAIKGHLLPLAGVDERFCHMDPAEVVAQLVSLWEGQRAAIKASQTQNRSLLIAAHGNERTITEMGAEIARLSNDIKVAINERSDVERERDELKAALDQRDRTILQYADDAAELQSEIVRLKTERDAIAADLGYRKKRRFGAAAEPQDPEPSS